MKVLATYNIKGGVGKTATAVNLAYHSAERGARTLLWDLDPQAAATYCFRIKAKVKGGGKGLIRGRRPLDRAIRGTDFDGLDLLPADFSYRNLDLFLDHSKQPTRRLTRLLRPLADDYDCVYLDCAPSISLVSESVFAAADALLVPTIPATLSLNTLRQLEKHLAKQGFDRLMILPFFSMVDLRKSLHREICASSHESPFRFLDTRIPYSSLVEQMAARRAPLATYSQTSPATAAYRRLMQEVVTRIDGIAV